MMRKSSKIFSVVTLLLVCILLFGIIFANRSINASADFSEIAEDISEDVVKQEPIEEKNYCKATLEDDFADDTVLVVLNKEATLKTGTGSQPQAIHPEIAILRFLGVKLAHRSTNYNFAHLP